MAHKKLQRWPSAIIEKLRTYALVKITGSEITIRSLSEICFVIDVLGTINP